MYERFTDRARTVMQLALEEAQRLNHEEIRTEHILLGLVREGSGVAAHVLTNLGVNLSQIPSEIERLVPPRAASPPDPPAVKNAVKNDPPSSLIGRFLAFAVRAWTHPQRLPQHPRVKKVIEYAMDEARRFGHNYVGTEHLLLGLLYENESGAAQVLRNLGLRLEALREETLRVLNKRCPGS